MKQDWSGVDNSAVEVMDVDGRVITVLFCTV